MRTFFILPLCFGLFTIYFPFWSLTIASTGSPQVFNKRVLEQRLVMGKDGQVKSNFYLQVLIRILNVFPLYVNDS